jgi:hypothetical protein
MAEAMSRLSNPRRPEMAEKAPVGVDDGTEQPEGDAMHGAAEAMHAAEPGSKHMIVSHDGYGMKSHGIDEQGKHEPEQGAHDHENIEELKGHLGKFFNEEEHEGKDDGGEEPEENQSLY